MGKQRKWILVKQFEGGTPKLSDFKQVEVDLPDLQDGDILLDAVFLSVDPYMRELSKHLKDGDTMIGFQVAKVSESKNPDYPVGTYVLTNAGWTDRCVQTKSGLLEAMTSKLADMGELPKSLALGTLGMTGSTAYFGLLKICEPKEGDVVLVNSAAGAVGNMVGQIAKIKGCKVIGYTRSDEKVKFLKEELGFDHAFNYKTTDLDTSLKLVAPEGVDCYFDNVGGDFSYNVVANHMKMFGRMAICGFIDSFDKMGNPKTGPYPWYNIMMKQLRIEGFNVFRWVAQFSEAITAIVQWISEGKLKYKEHMTEGFNQMPSAFIDMLEGKNIGKAVVKV